MPMKVAIVTALWYEDKFLPALFASLGRVEYPLDEWEIIMIDNKNSAATRKWFEDNIHPKVGKTLPAVTLLATDRNLGFAGGNNACILAAKERGCGAVYLLNEDAHGDPGFLKEALRRMGEDEKIGAVQSFLVLDPASGGMNSIGNEFHYLGFSYCGGYKMSRHDAAGYLRVRRLTDPDLNISGASGAAVLLRVSALLKVGLFDEDYHLYHEDLDLSLRLREAGYMVVIEPASVVNHRYEFSRSVDKYYWMERNRYRLTLEHYKIATLLVLLPGFLVSELGLIVFGAFNGSLGSRLRAYGYIFDIRNWSEIADKRRRVQEARKISDRELLRSAVSDISFQETSGPAMKIINPLMAAYWAVARRIIFW
jgi:GT2 family glycosyltransferase